MAPYDFAVITSLDVGSNPILIDTDMEKWEAAWFELLGAYPPVHRTRMVRYTWFAERFRDGRGDRVVRQGLPDVCLRYHLIFE
ncbi:hypothetical protein ACSBR1_037663 [Camellia fascicularis]